MPQDAFFSYFMLDFTEPSIYSYLFVRFAKKPLDGGIFSRVTWEQFNLRSKRDTTRQSGAAPLQ
jgi:hypothetical protein